ncbi:hypothetical protein FO505_01410 [Bacillus altitudinis]|nr:hypothetical protein [Bacillus altitudinis]
MIHCTTPCKRKHYPPHRLLVHQQPASLFNKSLILWNHHDLWLTVGRSGFLMMYKSKLDQKLFLHEKHPLQS